MYEVEVWLDFSSAHHLKGYRGKCEDVHGHNWKVTVAIASEDLDDIGIVVDFKVLKKKLNDVLKRLDHKDLNELPAFKKKNPTSENLAKYIYDELRKKRLKASRVSVWESHNSKATYWE